MDREKDKGEKPSRKNAASWIYSTGKPHGTMRRCTGRTNMSKLRAHTYHTGAIVQRQNVPDLQMEVEHEQVCKHDGNRKLCTGGNNGRMGRNNAHGKKLQSGKTARPDKRNDVSLEQDNERKKNKRIISRLGAFARDNIQCENARVSSAFSLPIRQARRPGKRKGNQLYHKKMDGNNGI